MTLINCEINLYWCEKSIIVGVVGNTIQFVGSFDIFSEFFVPSLLIVWADGVNGCGPCLAGGRGC